MRPEPRRARGGRASSAPKRSATQQSRLGRASAGLGRRDVRKAPPLGRRTQSRQPRKVSRSLHRRTLLSARFGERFEWEDDLDVGPCGASRARTPSTATPSEQHGSASSEQREPGVTFGRLGWREPCRYSARAVSARANAAELARTQRTRERAHGRAARALAPPRPAPRRNRGNTARVTNSPSASRAAASCS